MKGPVFNLGIDIDGTINDLNSHLNAHVIQWLEHWGIVRTPDLTKYLIQDRYDLIAPTANILMRMFNYSRIPLLDEFLDNCYHIDDPTIRIIYITHRDPHLNQLVMKDPEKGIFIHETLEKVTYKQLEKVPIQHNKFNNLSSIFFVDDKAGLCKSLGIDLMIEDCPTELENLIANGVPTMKRPHLYNEHIDIPSIPYWGDFLRNFKKSEIYLNKMNGDSK